MNGKSDTEYLQNPGQGIQLTRQVMLLTNLLEQILEHFILVLWMGIRLTILCAWIYSQGWKLQAPVIIWPSEES